MELFHVHVIKCLYSEIKCPFNYQKELKEREKDENFPLNADKSFQEKHRFYFQTLLQIQLQMFVHNLEECQFLILCK